MGSAMGGGRAERMLPRAVNGTSAASQWRGGYSVACRSPPYRPAGRCSDKINASVACNLYPCQETLFAVARARALDADRPR